MGSELYLQERLAGVADDGIARGVRADELVRASRKNRRSYLCLPQCADRLAATA